MEIALSVGRKLGQPVVDLVVVALIGHEDVDAAREVRRRVEAPASTEISASPSRRQNSAEPQVRQKPRPAKSEARYQLSSPSPSIVSAAAGRFVAA